MYEMTVKALSHCLIECIRTLFGLILRTQSEEGVGLHQCKGWKGVQLLFMKAADHYCFRNIPTHSSPFDPYHPSLSPSLPPSVHPSLPILLCPCLSICPSFSLCPSLPFSVSLFLCSSLSPSVPICPSVPFSVSLFLCSSFPYLFICPYLSLCPSFFLCPSVLSLSLCSSVALCPYPSLSDPLCLNLSLPFPSVPLCPFLFLSPLTAEGRGAEAK